jgi:hypothetical protein
MGPLTVCDLNVSRWGWRGVIDAFHRCDISMLADEYDRENQGHLARARWCARPKKMGIYYS